MKNTKLDLGSEVQISHLNKLMLKLKNSGYNQKFRTEVLDSSIKAFQRMVEEDKSGIKPLFRPREWNFEERQKSKNEKKRNWWNNENAQIQYTSVLFVTPTPGGVLAKEVRTREAEINRNSKERVKIEEKGGLKIKDILVSKNPFKKSKCVQKTCPLCKQSDIIVIDSEDVKIPCNTNNVGYRWLCVTCKERDIIKLILKTIQLCFATSWDEPIFLINHNPVKGWVVKFGFTIKAFMAWMAIYSYSLVGLSCQGIFELIGYFHFELYIFILAVRHLVL